MGELLVILLLALLIFGAGRLPEIGAAMGKTLKSFKKEMQDIEKDSTEKKS